MKLTLDNLTTNTTIVWPSSTLAERQRFFSTLESTASEDLSLAHSLFKVNGARAILSLAGQSIPETIGSFSVYKPFDTVALTGDRLAGTKHWITNLAQAEYGVYQIKHDADILLCHVSLSDAVSKTFNFLNAPGLADTCTGDATFDDCPVDVLFAKSDPRYFVSNNFNSLCFTVNYIGAVNGLVGMMLYQNSALFRARLKSLQECFDHEIAYTSFVNQSSDTFWHQRNALYLTAKQLLVDVCQHIVANCAGNFYNLNSAPGRHFYDCLIYSGHNGPISRNLATMFTEPQDL